MTNKTNKTQNNAKQVANLFNLSAARASLKQAKTPCAIVKTLYIFAEGNEGAGLRAVLPKSKQSAIDLIPAICAANNVGGTREVKTKDGQTHSYVIRFSADMFLRYICSTHNESERERVKTLKASKRAAEQKARAERKAKERAEVEARKAERAKASAERKAAKEKERAEKAAKRAAEQAKRNETAKKHVQVMKARAAEDKKSAKGAKGTKGAKRNAKK